MNNQQSNHDDFVNADPENQLYFIDYVQQLRIRNSQLQVLMKWKDYPKDQSTWEDDTIITNENSWCVQSYLRNYSYTQLQKLKQNMEPINGYSYKYDGGVLEVGVFEPDQQSQCQQPSVQQSILQQKEISEQGSSQNNLFNIKLEEQQQKQNEKKMHSNFQPTYTIFQNQQQKMNNYIIIDSDEQGSSQQSYSNGHFRQELRRRELNELRMYQLDIQEQQLEQQQQLQSQLQRQRSDYRDQLNTYSFNQDLRDLLLRQKFYKELKRFNDQMSQFNQLGMWNGGSQQKPEPLNINIQQQVQMNDTIFNFGNQNNVQQFQQFQKFQPQQPFQQQVEIKKIPQNTQEPIQINDDMKENQQQFLSKSKPQEQQIQNYIVIQDETINQQPEQEEDYSLIFHSSEEEEDEKEGSQVSNQENQLKDKRRNRTNRGVSKQINKTGRIKKIPKQQLTRLQRFEDLKLKQVRSDTLLNYQTQLMEMSENQTQFAVLQTTHYKRDTYGQIPKNQVLKIVKHVGKVKGEKQSNKIKIKFTFEVQFVDPLLKNNYFSFYHLFRYERKLLKEYIDSQKELEFMCEMFEGYYREKTQFYDKLNIQVPNCDRVQ